MGRAAVFVDVCAVRRCAEHMYFCTQTCKEFLCCGGRTAVCAVQRHTDVGAVCCNTACQIRDVVLFGISVLRNRTDTDIGLQLDFFRVIQDQRLDLFFGSIRQLITGSRKQLDAVELHAVMGCRDHNACICTVCPYQICHSRRGNYAQLDCLCPDRTDSGAEAASRISEEIRVSFPIKIFARCFASFVSTRAAALPICIAISQVSSVMATPLAPSVPNNLPMILFPFVLSKIYFRRYCAKSAFRLCAASPFS